MYIYMILLFFKEKANVCTCGGTVLLVMDAKVLHEESNSDWIGMLLLSDFK
jgi:hypothetical protein